MDNLNYSNAVTSLNVENWPLGGSRRGLAAFYIETDPKRGERACRRTVTPSGGLSKPVKLTYAKRVRIMTGSDGRTYIVSFGSGFFYVMRGDMKFCEESIFDTDPRFNALKEAFQEPQTICRASGGGIECITFKQNES